MIVNADDLGIERGCNDVMFDLMASGKLTSATILANCPGTEDALERARQYPNCSFGVHLNASAFRPLTGDPDLQPLLDHQGRLSGTKALRNLGRRVRQALYREFCAQIERVRASGLSISHVDSHHHVHNLPCIFPILKAVQRRYGIRRVRIGKNLYGPGDGVSLAARLRKAAYNWALRNFYRTETTDGFTDLSTFCRMENSTRGLRTVELMVHPGPKTARYVKELELLTSDWEKRVPYAVRKINYHELSHVSL